MTEPTPAYGQPPAHWRPSESDRQTIADRLRTAADEGRIDLMEYDRRLRSCEAAPTMADLHAVVADLPYPPASSEQVLVQVGEVAVTPTTIHTPAGPIPLRGSAWQVKDHWLAQQKTPTWAIVLAITGAALGVVLIVCTFFISLLLLLCLLFLLAKETRYHGTVDIAVSNGGLHYVARLPVRDHAHVQHIYNQVNYARSLAGR